VIKKQGDNAGAGNAPALEAESQNTGEGTSEDVSVGTDDAAYSGDGEYYGDYSDYGDYSTDDGSNYDYGETDYSWIVDLDNDGYDDNTGYYYWGG
jgi:hypothetical protein